MYALSSYLGIPDFLNTQQLAQISQVQANASYDDGKYTATDGEKEIKNNLQMNTGCMAYSTIQQVLVDTGVFPSRN